MALSAQALEDRQQEWKTLMNEFRLLEQSRKEYSEENTQQLVQQREKIDFLQCENEVLRSEVDSLSRHMNQSHASFTQQDVLRQIQEAGQRYSEFIEAEKLAITTLKESIDTTRKMLFEKQKQIGGVFAPLKTEDQINKHYRMLQQRLELKTHQYNELVSQTKSLRSTLEGLKKQRQAFESVNRKLDRDVDTTKRRMNDIIESTNEAYQRRDAYLLEIAAIDEADRQQKREFDAKIKEIDRLLEEDFKIPRSASSRVGSSPPRLCSLTATARERNSPNVGLLRLPGVGNRRESQKESRLLLRSESLGSADSATTEVARCTWSSNSQLGRSFSTSLVVSTQDVSPSTIDGSLQMTEYQPVDTMKTLGITEDKAIVLLQSFEAAVERLQEGTGIDDLERVSHTFAQAESRNHQLFKFIDEQHREIEQLKASIDSLVLEKRSLSDPPREINSKKFLTLEDDRDETSNAALMRWKQRNAAMAIIVSDSMQRLYSILARVSSVPPQLETSDTGDGSNALVVAGESVDVRDVEVERCLQRLETELAALMCTHHTLQETDQSQSMSVVPVGDQASTRSSQQELIISGQQLFCLRPPSSSDSNHHHSASPHSQAEEYSLSSAPVSPMHPASFRVPALAGSRAQSHRSLKISPGASQEVSDKPLSRDQIRSGALEVALSHPLMKQRSLSAFKLEQ